MRVSLLYNRDAGAGTPLDRILEALDQNGHELVRVVEKHGDLADLLKSCPDLVGVAGGDGTVACAAKALAHRGIPLAILPLGTANNIARSLGVTGSIEEVVGRWKTACRRPFDLGVAQGAFGRRHFAEAVGGGLIPTAIADMHTRSDGKKLPPSSKVAGAVRVVSEVFSELRPGEWTIAVDGVRSTGEFLLVAVLNIRSIGPNLVLSGEATPSDGLFDVVTASEQHRQEITGYLEQLQEGRDPAPLSLPSQRARQVTLEGTLDIHIDDKVLSESGGEAVSIRIDASALELLA